MSSVRTVEITGTPQKHAQKAKQRAASDNRDKHPDARQTDRLAHDVRVNQVALDLLQNNQEDDELYRLQGVLRQNHRSAHDAADPCAGERNERGHTHNKAN